MSVENRCEIYDFASATCRDERDLIAQIRYLRSTEHRSGSIKIPIICQALEHQIALLWQAIEKISAARDAGDCVPDDAARKERFEAEKLNQLVGK